MVLMMLGESGMVVEDLTATATSMLDDPDERVRARAGALLCSLGRGTERARAAVASILRSQNMLAKTDTLVLVRQFGTQAAFLLGRVVEMCSDPEARVRVVAIRTLSSVDGRGDLLCGALQRGAGDLSPDVRTVSYEIAGDMASSCQLRESAIAYGVRDVDARVRVAAVRYLLRKHGQLESLATILSKCTEDVDAAAREAAVAVIGEYLFDQPEARRRLERLATDDREPSVRRAAQAVLKRQR